MPSPSACVIPVHDDCPFSWHNIPFGVYKSKENDTPRTASAIGEYLIDLKGAAEAGIFNGESALSQEAIRVFSMDTLNAFMELGRDAWRGARRSLQAFLCTEDAKSSSFLVPIKHATMCLPMAIGDYTDFYSSKEHAINVGTMFRGKDNALQPNWLHMPIGYHGRASSVIPSGTAIPRPSGQIKPKDGPPVFGACQKLDFELEMVSKTSRRAWECFTYPLGICRRGRK